MKLSFWICLTWLSTNADAHRWRLPRTDILELCWQLEKGKLSSRGLGAREQQDKRAKQHILLHKFSQLAAWHVDTFCSSLLALQCYTSQNVFVFPSMIVIGANLMAWHLLILLNLSFLEAHGGGLQLSFPCIKVIAMPSQWHRTFPALVCSVDCCDCMVPVTEFAQPHALSFQCHLSFPQSLLNGWLEFRKGRQCTEVQPVQMESCFCCLKEFFTSLILHH